MLEIRSIMKYQYQVILHHTSSYYTDDFVINGRKMDATVWFLIKAGYVVLLSVSSQSLFWSTESETRVHSFPNISASLFWRAFCVTMIIYYSEYITNYIKACMI